MCDVIDIEDWCWWLVLITDAWWWLMLHNWRLMTDDWSDDWWLVTVDWWLMIDDWWLTIDDRCLIIHDCDWWLVTYDRWWWWVVGGWLLVVDDWRLLVDGFWFMIDPWWLVVWWLMLDDWWLWVVLYIGVVLLWLSLSLSLCCLFLLQFSHADISLLTGDTPERSVCPQTIACEAWWSQAGPTSQRSQTAKNSIVGGRTEP